jgi:hypothetical protein
MMVETQSPLARLVLFMICLAVAGSIIAGVYYYAVELPAQKAASAPENSWCTDQCYNAYFNCVSIKGSDASACIRERDACVIGCEGKTYPWIKQNP